jgi:hypothetical protein
MGFTIVLGVNILSWATLATLGHCFFEEYFLNLLEKSFKKH